MVVNQFVNIPIIHRYANLPIWTVSDNNKRPIDFNALLQKGIIVGASFGDSNNQNQPLVTLHDIVKSNLNVTNVTMLLNQSSYPLVVLDIEPSCPDDIKQKLAALPCAYMETSMSGHGLHMIFENIQTQYPDILMNKQVLKEQHKYYEFLLNRHFVTFTGNALQNVPTRPVEDIQTEFDTLAQNATLVKVTELDTTNLPALMSIPMNNLIVGRLINEINYDKTPDDFGNDISRYEFGFMGFIYVRLINILCSAPYNTNNYSKQERLVLLYEISKMLLPYRPKHDEFRQGMPYIMYLAKRMITTEKAEKE